MSKASVSAVRVKKFSESPAEETMDLLAVEEPLEIRLSSGTHELRQQRSISVTMRTPGNDFELAIGFLFTEGIIRSPDDILKIRYCEKENSTLSAENIVLVDLKENVELDFEKLQRNFYTSSSCGVCGKASIEAVQTAGAEKIISNQNRFLLNRETLLTLPEKLREKQLVFGHTGGLHAAALFSSTAELLFLREDIGRHNAVDKVIGAAFQEKRIPLDDCILFLSGRSGFELIQKAVMAGIPCVASVGAPSSLAVSLAQEFNITLIGFVRDKRFNIYNGQERFTV